MIRWKWMPGFLYQTEDAGKSKTVERQKERESVKDRVLLEESDNVGNKMDH
jgi:hypothetical protein